MHPDTKALIADPLILDAFENYAIAQYPNEACGAITPDGFVPLENKAADPRHFFDCKAEVAELVIQERLVAVVHSHPDGPEGPSHADMQAQISMDVPWGLLMCDAEFCSAPYFWGDCLEPPPLIGRGFRHGPSGTDNKGDCYALIKDWYKLERGVTLMEGPRSNRWWLEGQDLYFDNFAAAGFHLADRTHPEPGDVFLLQLGKAATAQHGGIYLGDGMALHHLQGRLSRKEPFSNWVKLLRAWLRHGG